MRYCKGKERNTTKKAAIIAEVIWENQEAEHAEIVEGGVMIFDSYNEYKDLSQCK